ncbi:MAG: discoidin domain-containing protein [Sedimentisphaerales bacterium]|jgi:alpha-L-fucosidase
MTDSQKKILASLSIILASLVIVPCFFDTAAQAEAPVSIAGPGPVDVNGEIAAANNSIAYATQQVIFSNDSDSVIVEKAAKVLPRPNQSNWMRLEWTFFLHYGVNTFRGVEWGNGREDPSQFNPSAFDANQWVSAMKDAGGKMIVLVCKHHDGLCLWPTRYTSHSVASSSWLDGKGDVVRAVADAARKHGLKLGVYLSPADLYQLKTNPKNPAGYYGNDSNSVLSVIPTDPASFKNNPALGRTPPAGFTSYKYVVDDYNRYFLNQLYELLTEYGPIQEVWFDGANPDPSVKETYNYNAWFDLIRHLQPGAIIFGKGPDGRWVGNEGGIGRTTEWSVIPLPVSPDNFLWPDMQAGDLGSRAKLKPGSYLWWYSTETNVTILANGQWFWGPRKHPRSLPQLVDIYYTSIGRNGNLILNLSPDKRGLIPDDQLEALSRMAQVIKDTFAKDLAIGGKMTADTSNAANSPSLALDGNLDTWWEAAPGHTTAALTLTLPAAITFDVVSLQEAVDHRGQRIESFVIEALNGTAWVTAEKIASDELTTVGHKRLIRLKSPVTTSQVRIRITGSRLEPTLAEIGLFKQSVYGQSPVISDRDTNGQVTIGNTSGLKMVYTIDGNTPTANSAVYSSPISLPLTGTVQAACVMPNGQLGIVTSKTFAGLPPTGWKVVAVDSQETAGADNSAANAIDGNSSTFWHTRWNEDLKLPHFITIDMGTSHRIAGFTYLPRQDGNLNGTAENYRFETSMDGVTWTTNVASGTFANIRNNPSLQQVSFAPVNARFFRFTALQEINKNGWTSAAEISVLPAIGLRDN